ncbi:MAG: DUF4115 domain-containing protein [Polaromonas sp.]|nr:DUF4115 domain-containing protein [Polaromonas sp.]
MSETAEPFLPGNPDPDTPVSASAGRLLKQAREASGLHIAALAVALKVPVKKLEALEADRFDLLPDAVFVRALASSVCRTLKIDAAPVLALLPQTHAPRLAPQRMGMNVPFSASGDAPGPSVWTHVSRPAVIAGLMLLLGALVLVLLPAVTRDTDAPAVNPVTGVQENPGAPAPAESITLAPTETLNPSTVPAVSTGASTGTSVVATPTVAAATAIGSAGAAALSPAAVASAPLAASTTVSPAALAAPATAAVSAPVGLSTSGIVVFRASSESWVEVTDARGVVVLRRTLAAGDVAGVSGALPMAAVVGRVDATQVQVRGKALDLTALARDNVARFEVR